MIGMNTLVGWLFSVVFSLASPGTTSAKGEDVTERAARLQSIAQDIADVVFDASEEPLFEGPLGREKSAIFVATFASHESVYFSKEVDYGTRRGDGGSSWCLMQRHIGKNKTTEGWTGPDLVQDRKKCILSGYRIMKLSWKKCKGPEEFRGAAYISGRCDWAKRQSSERHKHAMDIFRKNTLDKYIALHPEPTVEFGKIYAIN